MRFSEMDSMRADQLDFVPRAQRNQIFRTIVAFAFIIAVIFIGAYAPPVPHLEFYTPFIAMLLVALLCLYVVIRKQQSIDQVMSAEYQLMLFAQAATLNSSFCMFVRRDGTIVFADDGLSRVFPRFDYAGSQALEGLFEQSNIRKTDRERIMSAIVSHSSDSLIFPISNAMGQTKEYVITVDPLPRPSGFVVIRGREYLGQRSGVQLMPDVLRSTSVDKLDHMLATTSVAHYTTDSFGKFEYVNPAFSTLLGYTGSDILDSKLSLHNLFVTFGANVITEEYALGDYRGEASLLHRSGAHIKAIIGQSIIRDGAGKLIGATGTIVPPAA